MCSACVLDSFSIAAMMAVMPPSTRMDSVEKLVCAPVPGAAAVTAFRGPGCYASSYPIFCHAPAHGTHCCRQCLACSPASRQGHLSAEHGDALLQILYSHCSH